MNSESTIINENDFNSSLKGDEVPEIKEKEKEKESYEYYTPTQRKLYLSLVSLAGLMAPMASTIFFPALLQMKADFQATDTLMDLSVSIFIFTIAIAPLFWGGGSDLYGRRWVYIISQFVFVASCIGCALSPDINVFIVMRVLQGVGSSAPLVVGIGTISDIYPREQRGTALGLFFIGPLIGPVLGPIIGGFLAKYVGWRVIFWLMTGLSGAILLIIIFFVKETLPINRTQPFPIRVTLSPLKISTQGKLFNPFAPIYYLKFPAVAMGCFYGALIFATYYAVSISQTRGMTVFYSLDASTIGLTYIALGVGNIVGSSLGGKISDILLKRAITKNGKASPEIRLHPAIVGALAILAGLLMNGWFIQYKLPLGATLFAQFLVGFGMTFVFGNISTYLVDLYPLYGASITSVANCVRMIGAGIIITVNSIVLDSLNFGWAFTLFGLLQIIGIFILIILVLYGTKIRGSD